MEAATYVLKEAFQILVLFQLFHLYLCLHISTLITRDTVDSEKEFFSDLSTDADYKKNYKNKDSARL